MAKGGAELALLFCGPLEDAAFAVREGGSEMVARVEGAAEGAEEGWRWGWHTIGHIGYAPLKSRMTDSDEEVN